MFKRAIKNQTWVFINGWHLRNLNKNTTFFCCLLSQSKITKNVTVSKRKYFGGARETRVAYQHQCNLENITDNKEIIAATLVWRKSGLRTDLRQKNNVLCPTNKHQYRFFDHVVDPDEMGVNRTFANLSGTNIALNKTVSDFKLAICAKLAYGDLDVDLTIEWMEYHRYVSTLFRLIEFFIMLHKIKSGWPILYIERATGHTSNFNKELYYFL